MDAFPSAYIYSYIYICTLYMYAMHVLRRESWVWSTYTCTCVMHIVWWVFGIRETAILYNIHINLQKRLPLYNGSSSYCVEINVPNPSYCLYTIPLWMFMLMYGNGEDFKMKVILHFYITLVILIPTEYSIPPEYIKQYVVVILRGTSHLSVSDLDLWMEGALVHATAFTI